MCEEENEKKKPCHGISTDVNALGVQINLRF